MRELWRNCFSMLLQLGIFAVLPAMRRRGSTTWNRLKSLLAARGGPYRQQERLSHSTASRAYGAKRHLKASDVNHYLLNRNRRLPLTNPLSHQIAMLRADSRSKYDAC